MSALTRQIEEAIAQRADLYIAVEEHGGQIVLTGLIDSVGQRDAAIDIASDLAPGMVIVDNLEIDTVLPEELDSVELSEAAVGDFPAATPGTEDNEALEPGDFTDQHILTNPMNVAGPTGVAADEEYRRATRSTSRLPTRHALPTTKSSAASRPRLWTRWP